MTVFMRPLFLYELAARSSKAIIALFLLVISVSDADSRDVEVWFDYRTGLALGGYDTVAYFTRRKSIGGYSEYQVTKNGVTWYFENIGNKEAFIRHPNVYKPKFSGYDPYALSKGKIARGSPRLWVLEKDRLYLFENIINKRLWLYDIEKYRKKAQANWPALSKNLIPPIR